ncbi:tetraether lipid synthase Tes [Natronobacterium gregoryi]|uniref:Fe-S oxidoreductase n=1 Tax=Natronobacterium gregoryi (strain ATCC 43098 / DSM 3393 / CCM 3738 / CIP 104747 / IAM 13177 / JCM 8860 / NBRC 102187 / NCIMB 2189 / SP2) TaxID=797304 RepID=L9XM70_NATGS|nr:radical SAM protein [Natronobacterium gregoryi]ELY62486.1 Fe-S oxidoreductase [Natronobacterium gregoryi SP2]
MTVSSRAPLSREDAIDFASRIAPGADRYLKVTGSLCPDCVAADRDDDLLVPMVVYEAADEIRLAKVCDDHGEIRDVYWRDASLYYRARAWDDESDHLGSSHHEPDGVPTCPTDCGLCPAHESHTGLGNVSVTNRCDLSCWYCFFYAREDDPLYEPTKSQIREMAAAMADEEPIGCNAIQLTGGEPTLREDIDEVVETVGEVVDHIQLNTHGATLADDTALAHDLREAGVNTLYTSFDGVDPETNPKNYWEMPDALRACREAQLPVVLVPTVIGGQNDHQLADIIRFAAANIDVVRGVNFQPVSLVGRMPDHQRHAQRVTIPDAIHAIEDGTNGAIPADAWYPVPSVLPVSAFSWLWNERPLYELSAHFACGMATYAYVDEDRLVPITEFVDVDEFLRALEELADEFDAPLGRLQRARVGTRLAYELYRVVDRSAEPDDVHFGRWLLESLRSGTYDGLVEFHRNALFLGMMHFMDPYNYDVDRVERCSVHYGMPDGRVVPFCSYNVLPERYRDVVQEAYAIGVEEWLERDYARAVDADAADVTRLRSETITAREEDQEALREGPGVYGYDVKRRRDLDESARDRIHETYDRALTELEPV